MQNSMRISNIKTPTATHHTCYDRVLRSFDCRSEIRVCNLCMSATILRCVPRPSSPIASEKTALASTVGLSSPTATTSSSRVTRSPTGVAAVCSNVTLVPTESQPSSPALCSCSNMVSRTAHSMSQIMAGVLYTSGSKKVVPLLAGMSKHRVVRVLRSASSAGVRLTRAAVEKRAAASRHAGITSSF